MDLRSLALDDLTIDDEESFRHVGLYRDLKEALRRSPHRFRVPAAGDNLSWDRAVFLNLTYWSAAEESSVLCDDHIAPDVVAHTAWHHVTARALGLVSPPGPPSAAALLFCEAIASAFDLYLVGRLLQNAPESDFITTQVPIMAQATDEAGLSEAGFARLLESVSANPERAFEDMRALLVDAGAALLGCGDAAQAHNALDQFAGHAFGPLLHHFALSNWILYARAYASIATSEGDRGVRDLDQALRASPISLDWLAAHWLTAAPNAA